MFSSFVFGLLDLWFSLISKVVGIIISPLFNYLLNQQWISVDYFNNMQVFILDKFLPSLKFSRDVFINITGLPVEFFMALGLLLTTLLSLSFTFIFVKALLNVFFFIRGGRSVGVFSKK